MSNLQNPDLDAPQKPAKGLLLCKVSTSEYIVLIWGMRMYCSKTCGCYIYNYIYIYYGHLTSNNEDLMIYIYSIQSQAVHLAMAEAIRTVLQTRLCPLWMKELQDASMKGWQT
jgi:hypothetical protein